MPTDLDLDLAFATAQRAAEAATQAALKHFRSAALAVETKPDRSPVTAADRESEAAILDVVLAAFPGASVLAEESGARAGDPDLRWIVDPLDGTRGFTRGGSFWGSLVALEHAGEIVAGSMALPALGEIYCAARGRGCFKNGARVRLSSVEKWDEATLSLGELHKLLVPPHGAAVQALATSCATTRAYGDVGSVAMLLSGRADAWLEAGVRVWDLAPTKILVEEAGGVFTDLAGVATVESGSAVAANPTLQAHMMAALR
jgi:histidinol-phosphatase